MASRAACFLGAGLGQGQQLGQRQLPSRAQLRRLTALFPLPHLQVSA